MAFSGVAEVGTIQAACGHLCILFGSDDGCVHLSALMELSACPGAKYIAVLPMVVSDIIFGTLFAYGLLYILAEPLS